MEIVFRIFQAMTSQQSRGGLELRVRAVDREHLGPPACLDHLLRHRGWSNGIVIPA